MKQDKFYKYINDKNFHNLVDTIFHLLKEGTFSLSDLCDVLSLADLKYKEWIHEYYILGGRYGRKKSIQKG